MQCEADLRDDEDSKIEFSADMVGFVLHAAGNSCDIAILLDDVHLQSIFDQLIEYGFESQPNAQN